MNNSRLLGLGLVASAFFLSACTSQPAAATADKPTEAKDEYVRYTPTGTWMSKKVKKDQVKSTDQESAAAQQAMQEIQRRANQVPKDH